MPHPANVTPVVPPSPPTPPTETPIVLFEPPVAWPSWRVIDPEWPAVPPPVLTAAPEPRRRWWWRRRSTPSLPPTDRTQDDSGAYARRHEAEIRRLQMAGVRDLERGAAARRQLGAATILGTLVASVLEQLGHFIF